LECSFFDREPQSYRENIGNLSKAGCVSTVDSHGRTIWIADAHRDGKRFVARADELLTAFLELEAVIRGCG